MRIAFVSNLVEPTGGDNILYNHALGLTRRGHDVTAYFSDFMDSTRAHDEDWNSGKVRVVLYGDDLLAQSTWVGYDLIVANGLNGATKCMQIHHPNKAWFCQNFDPYIFGKTPDVDGVYRYYDKYITYSHDLGTIIKYYYGQKKIVYCNNGIDYKSFVPFQNRGVRKNKRVCFMVAYYRPYKGIKFANEVFGILKDKGYTTVEINATVGPLENTMEIYQNPSFEDKCQIIAGCGTMLHPSVFETWGLVPMESMALGVPVVGVDSKGIMEYATKKNSLIYNERNAELVADGIRMLSEKGHDIVYEDMQKEGIKTAEEHDWDTIMPQIEQSYMELIN